MKIGGYVAVIAVWVALLDSGHVILWGPGASWHWYVVVIGWSALTIRRAVCDLAELRRHCWWNGYATRASDETKSEISQ